MIKYFCVISHAHWDREWYQPFEQFRYRLVHLIDNLLELLKEQPEYIFHLDAQTIVLEDYLEIKPQNREIIQRYIKKGNIIVGPWYVQNDFYLTSGESTIRNLMIGTRIAKEFGACAKVGYCPDQFGIISQLPQILNSFGIDNCIFGRGYAKYLCYEREDKDFRNNLPPSEFIWHGADETKILGIHLPFWYNNCQRISDDSEKAYKLFKKLENNFNGLITTPYMLIMNGSDHLEAQENLMDRLEKLQSEFGEDKKIIQTTMQDYVSCVKEYLNINKSFDPSKMHSHYGELRTGNNNNILQNTLSSQIHLKILNAKAQNILENIIEPLFTFISMQVNKDVYPEEFINYLWKSLLMNHPHDSICGCSHNDVHAQMEDRYNRFFNLADMLIEEGLTLVSNHIDRSNMTLQDHIILACNFSELRNSRVIEATVEIPADEEREIKSIVDKNNKEIDFEIIEVNQKYKNVYSPINLPGVIYVNEYRIRLFVRNLLPYSFNAFIVKTCISKEFKAFREVEDTVLSGSLENDFVKVEISESGEICLYDKISQKKYHDILEIIDEEDTGDSYVNHNKNLPPISTKGIKPRIVKISDSRISQHYCLIYKMMIPEDFDFNNNIRGRNLLEHEITIDVILDKDCKWVRFDFHFDNMARSHRMRAIINTGIISDHTYSSAPFDVIKRDRRFNLDGTHNGDQPNNGFVDIMDEQSSVAILTNGIYEYKHYLDSEGRLAFTLLRATYGFGYYQFDGGQCRRHIDASIAIMPHKGDHIEAKLQILYKQFQCGILAGCYPSDTRKFSGGRPALQDSDIKEIFYRDDPYPEWKMEKETVFFDIKGAGVAITAVKKALNKDGDIIRLYNSSQLTQKVNIQFFIPLKYINLCSLNEEIIETRETDENSTLEIKPKEIITLMIAK